MKFGVMLEEDLMNLTDAELKAIKERTNEILQDRKTKKLDQALTDVNNLIEKFNDEGIYFYIHDKYDNKISITPRNVCVEGFF